MKLIVGGAYQGKTAYVMKKYNIRPEEIINGEDVQLCRLSEFKCIDSYHLFVKRLLKNGSDPVEITEKIPDNFPGIIIMNEIGNGIIPIEKSERIWREQVGKAGCFLAGRAESVERIVCGQAVLIKG